MNGKGFDEKGGSEHCWCLRPSPLSKSHRMPAELMPLTVSVVICAYTEDRWPLLVRSVSSVQHQSRSPLEIIVCLDHNDSLLERCRRQWANQADSPSTPVVVLANRYEGRLGFGAKFSS